MPDAPLVVARALEAVLRSGDGVGPTDLVVRPGEAVLVVGPSGSGKTTLLRMLHGAVPQSVPARVTGSVHIAGRDIAAHRVAELADVVGVMAQDPQTGVCLPDVEDEVAFPLENLATPIEHIDSLVTATLERAGAAALRERRTAELSGGELQRVALAAATAATPALLLLDEPTAMLDGDGVETVRAAIAAVRASTGTACVLVEHRLDELAGDAGLDGLPDHWVVLDSGGRVVHDGPPAALTTDALRMLVAEGCWLPLEFELRALLGTPDETADALEDRAVRLASTAGSDSEAGADSVTGMVDGVAHPPRNAEGLRARALAVAPPAGLGGPKPEPVLRGIDVELRAGEAVALVGANGSGKSTLLTCLAGLATPAAGTVEGPRAGLVMQRPEHQFTATTVRGEVAHGLPRSRLGRVDAALERFGLSRLADHDPYRLSGGQQRRLSLAAMLVHEHPLLLADEPTFGLDRRGTVGVLRALREVADAGRGVLFSSHDARAIATIADRVLVLGDGGLLADVTPLEMLHDAGLLAAAGLRPSRLVRRLGAEAVARASEPGAADAALRRGLWWLDDLALVDRDRADGDLDARDRAPGDGVAGDRVAGDRTGLEEAA